jgi:hypothetical protein
MNIKIALIIMAGILFRFIGQPALATDQIYLPDCKTLIKSTVIQPRVECIPVTDHGPRFKVRS